MMVGTELTLKSTRALLFLSRHLWVVSYRWAFVSLLSKGSDPVDGGLLARQLGRLGKKCDCFRLLNQRCSSW